MAAPKGHPKYGGGRPPGGLNKATLEIKELAREHGPAGIARLAEIAFEDPPGDLEAVKIIKAMIKDGATTVDIAKFARASFGTRNDLTRVAAVKELFDRGYGKAIQPLSGPTGGAIPIDDGTPSMIVIARKVALAFRIAAAAAAQEKAGLIEDAVDGGD